MVDEVLFFPLTVFTVRRIHSPHAFQFSSHVLDTRWFFDVRRWFFRAPRSRAGLLDATDSALTDNAMERTQEVRSGAHTPTCLAERTLIRVALFGA